MTATKYPYLSVWVPLDPVDKILANESTSSARGPCSGTLPNLSTVQKSFLGTSAHFATCTLTTEIAVAKCESAKLPHTPD